MVEAVVAGKIIADGNNVKVEWNNDNLMINGKEQSAETALKYAKYKGINMTVETK